MERLLYRSSSVRVSPVMKVHLYVYGSPFKGVSADVARSAECKGISPYVFGSMIPVSDSKSGRRQQSFFHEGETAVQDNIAVLLLTAWRLLT
jgi:hypothetical protein